MSDYAETLRKHRRLAILRHLEAVPDYTGNASILQSVLAGLGLSTQRDQIVTDLVWLQDNGFVRLASHGDFTIVTATQSGVEIARGIATHPGIQRPGPRR